MQIQIVLILGTMLAALSAQAVQVPGSFLNGRTGLYRQTLGAACFTFDLATDSVPCNPAAMAKERNTKFKVQLFGGNNISYIPEAVEISKGEATPETIQKIFSKTSVSELQGAGSAFYMREKFSIAYEPYSVRLSSSIRNSALPELTLFGTLDETVSTQFASYIVEDLYLGLGVRYLRRQSVAARFFATDLAVENGMGILDPQDKSYFFIEPGILYAPENQPLRPEVSLTLVNGGIHSTSESTATDPLPEFHLGVGIAPDVGLGRWGFSLNAQWSSSDLDDRLEMLTFGTYYQIGILTTLASLSKSNQAIGFNVLFNHMNLGLSFLHRDEKLDRFESLKTRHVLLMLGIEI